MRQCSGFVIFQSRVELGESISHLTFSIKIIPKVSSSIREAFLTTCGFWKKVHKGAGSMKLSSAGYIIIYMSKYCYTPCQQFANFWIWRIHVFTKQDFHLQVSLWHFRFKFWPRTVLFYIPQSGLSISLFARCMFQEAKKTFVMQNLQISNIMKRVIFLKNRFPGGGGNFNRRVTGVSHLTSEIAS